MGIWGYLVIATAVVGLAMTQIGDSRIERRRTAARLAAVERRLQLIMDHFDIADPEPHLPEVIANLEQGKKIAAIKAYRDSTGTGLAEAKEAVERLVRDRGLDPR
jgi:ribosomal protein L7/L12